MVRQGGLTTTLILIPVLALAVFDHLLLHFRGIGFAPFDEGLRIATAVGRVFNSSPLGPLVAGLVAAAIDCAGIAMKGNSSLRLCDGLRNAFGRDLITASSGIGQVVGYSLRFYATEN